MSMLAEPRRKTAWTLNPRGKVWSDDSTKFGQRMLEKMGWKKGKGLGAKEQGIVSHVGVKFKNDNKGIGFTKDDSLHKRIMDFEEVLAGLAKNVEYGEQPLRKKSRVESLKKSKLIHRYPKLIRGKDTSQYKKEDLDCIFGFKRDLGKEDKESLCEVQDIGAVDNSFGVKTIVGGSMKDYLRNKNSSDNRNDAVISDNSSNLVGSKRVKRKGLVGDVDMDDGTAVATVSESFGVKTFVGGSLEDYLKRKPIVNISGGNASSENAVERKDDCGIVGENNKSLLKRVKKRKNKTYNKFETGNPLDKPVIENGEEKDVLGNDNPLLKKSKKKTKQKKDERNNDDSVVGNFEEDTDPEPKMEEIGLHENNQHVNRFDRTVNITEDKNVMIVNQISESQISMDDSRKCKKKRKSIDQNIEERSLVKKSSKVDICESSNSCSDKKKKKQTENICSSYQENDVLKKKKRKEKFAEETFCDKKKKKLTENICSSNEENYEVVKKKKKKEEKFVEETFCDKKKKKLAENICSSKEENYEVVKKKKKKEEKFVEDAICDKKKKKEKLKKFSSSENPVRKEMNKHELESSETRNEKNFTNVPGSPIPIDEPSLYEGNFSCLKENNTGSVTGSVHQKRSPNCVVEVEHKGKGKDKVKKKKGTGQKQSASNVDLIAIDRYKPLNRKDVNRELLSLTMKMFVGSNLEKIVGYGNSLP